MRRVNIHLEEELDQDLAVEAARSGESKAALLRRAARAFLDERAVTRGADPWDSYTGAVRGPTSDDGPDDDVIYGQ